LWHPALEFGSKLITLVPPSLHESTLRLHRSGVIIAVDFTRLDVVNRNAEFFAEAGVPFVMGTTGGDREKLLETVRRSRISAVIASNMATPVILVQAILEHAAQTFPNALEGWVSGLYETDQQPIPENVGGPAIRDWRPFLEALGATMSDGKPSNQVDPTFQVVGLINLMSPDGKAGMGMNYLIKNRGVNAEGTLRAIRFLAEKVRAGSQGEVFSMIDVLKG